jgi:hypothetical protein
LAGIVHDIDDTPADDMLPLDVTRSKGKLPMVDYLCLYILYIIIACFLSLPLKRPYIACPAEVQQLLDAQQDITGLTQSHDRRRQAREPRGFDGM